MNLAARVGARADANYDVERSMSVGMSLYVCVAVTITVSADARVFADLIAGMIIVATTRTATGLRNSAIDNEVVGEG